MQVLVALLPPKAPDWAQPTTGSPSCRPDATVSSLQVPAAAPSMKGVTFPEPYDRCLHLTPHFQTCKRTQCKIWWHS